MTPTGATKAASGNVGCRSCRRRVRAAPFAVGFCSIQGRRGAMANIATPTHDNLARRRSVQEHIDELPIWADGTALPSAPMTGMQWLIWSLAAAGKFFEGFVVFMTGVALPLLSNEFNIGAAEHGIISAASLFGILVGAVALGGLFDRFGRKPMFLAEMVI